MKTKRLIFALLVMLGMSLSSCYVEEEHHHGRYHHYHHHHEHGAEVIVR